MAALPDPDVLIARLKAAVVDPQNKLIVASLAEQSVRIAGVALTDPAAAEREMRFVRAATANLGAAEAAKVQGEIVDWISRIIRAAILG